MSVKPPMPFEKLEKVVKLKAVTAYVKQYIESSLFI